MYTIGNDELRAAPCIGKIVDCPICGKQHPVSYGKEILPDGSEIPSTSLAFYRCRGTTYLAWINEKSVVGR